MIRFIILLGYFSLTLYLQLSGKLSHYINLHYSYLVYISMVLSLLLALVNSTSGLRKSTLTAIWKVVELDKSASFYCLYLS